VGCFEVILVDTHIWLWSMNEPLRLSDDQQRAVLDNMVAISAISAWEFCLLAQKGRVESEGDPSAFVRQMLSLSRVEVIPIDAEIALRSRTLDFPHQDPADRFIAATAMVKNIQLVTSDRNLILAASINGYEVVS
jgi:PIN domain nuclease of toxin-antitoxin system